MITVPTLILYGQEDSLTPMEQAVELPGKVAGSELDIVPGASHGVIRKKPGVANGIINTWLAANFSASTDEPAVQHPPQWTSLPRRAGSRAESA